MESTSRQHQMSSSFLAPLVSLSGTRHGLDLLPSGKGPLGKYVSLTQSQENPSSETRITAH
ncbi:hypothetical protein DPMN_064621 [Dreissena polymorpha]|uniref:Uncharacterized protein n=1 Tax=Dreissena polymorpha TaxID=45954 RepID=A0A9D4CDH3_DREPO|nr:hypothetical protein DPMN_064621 [Dreissena polymorpha]